MTRIRWYLDEDAMARGLVRGLEARGVDVLTTFDGGMTGRDDEDQLERATQLGRVVFTFNVGDFCRLHAAYQESGRKHAGIVVTHRGRFTLGEQVHGLARLTAEVPAAPQPFTWRQLDELLDRIEAADSTLVEDPRFRRLRDVALRATA